MKKILLIGGGAREHIIAETLKKSPQNVEIFVVSKNRNPGLAAICSEYLQADVTDGQAICDFALKVRPDFAISGPEAPIEAGVVDALLELGVHSMAPLQTVGRLETSKAFTRSLLEKHEIEGNPLFRVFTDESGLGEFFDQLGEDYVVKADGLKGGKGVMVSGEHLHGKEAGMEFALQCLRESGRVVVEEKLVGQEFSLLFFCDGKTITPMPIVQDHKRAFEGDTGPNTGGMGTYSCADHLLPFIDAEDREFATKMSQEVVDALFKETGCYFKGIVYGGFMATARGVRLIEYNARFGDPEAMNILSLLESDFVAICEAVINQTLDQTEVKFSNLATVCKYVVPNGYPDKPISGEAVVVGEIPAGAQIYFASIDEREGVLYLGGSRAIACLGVSEDLSEAERIAEGAAKAIQGPVFHRSDIGKSEVIQAKIEMMEKVRDL